MLHCDPETLALRSLGEVVGTPEEDAHITSCEQCQAELTSLQNVVVAAKAGGPDMALVSPPERVWDRIQAELASDATGTDTTAAHPPAAPPVGAHALSVPPGDHTASVTPLRPRHRARSGSAPRTAPWLLAAAGIGGIVVGGVGTALVVTGEDAPQATVAASVDLEPLPDWDASGSAALTVAEDGTRVLIVEVDAPRTGEAEGFQEVWLIDTAVEGMVSLGTLEGSTGEFVLPESVEVGQFPIVDVSLEPVDGDPTHSGNSIVRGTFEA